MTSLYDNYVWLFNDCADDRVKDWFLMGGPVPLLCILLVYLYTVKVGLPAYMKSRPAYGLKTVIRWYNVFQVVANSIVCYKFLTSGWTTTLSLGCELPEFSYEPEPYAMLTWFWWTMTLKLVELIETAFFVLRKKDNQVSFLHVYHHFGTLMIVWIGVKFAGGGMATFAPMINTFIHVIMYSYYLMSAEAGPEFRAVLNKYKKWLTVVQMAQFTIVLLHSTQAMLPSCDAPRLIVWIFIPNVLVVYYLFYDFFKKSYKPQKLKK